MASRMGHSFQLIDRLSVINVTHKTVDESCISVDADFEQESLSASPASPGGDPSCSVPNVVQWV
jgi:hypothetical protein